ncbi:hypothetical protein AaE_014457 [Aphanomyces astaci]|uniref:Uncharacterized protein n=1 Tax=Aphanomyces astaci TaxID=112090 RepID=A0A6A4ZE03_APHAT|nr:hypothetical protein AaE_014457 [Aphanomyces astaci]
MNVCFFFHLVAASRVNGTRFPDTYSGLVWYRLGGVTGGYTWLNTMQSGSRRSRALMTATALAVVEEDGCRSADGVWNMVVNARNMMPGRTIGNYQNLPRDLSTAVTLGDSGGGGGGLRISKLGMKIEKRAENSWKKVQ